METVTRREWHARQPLQRTLLDPEAVKYLVFHYTASDADEQADHRNCPGRVKGVQDYHMDHQGWSDIAYNWLVCKHGYVFRGRGWRVRSAATGDANSFTVACCFLGDDTKGRDDVTGKGRVGMAAVWEFVKRNGPNLRDARGHRDFMSTSCPGDQLYAWLQRLK